MQPDLRTDDSDVYDHDIPARQRRIAWDGISFCVPSNWELAVFRFLRRGVGRIELEDEYSVRLEAEWTRSRKRVNMDRIMQRYEAASKPLTLKSEAHHAIEGLPDGWHATHFIFRETGTDEAQQDLHVKQHGLATVFYVCPRKSIFCFFLLHFLPEDTEDPVALVQGLSTTFQDHRQAQMVPWALFDIACGVPRRFVLEEAKFDIGAKLMVFKWKSRRFYLWHFSCADMFLKNGTSPEQWAAAFLNGFKGLKVPVFRAHEKRGITWRRHRLHPFGHRQEIARWCYRYDVGCQKLDQKNMLVVWVSHYRHESDLQHTVDRI